MPPPNFSDQCKSVRLSPVTRERLPLPVASVSSDRSAQHTADPSGHNVSMWSPPVALRYSILIQKLIELLVERMAMTTRSFALARLRRHREAVLKPRIPERCLVGEGSGRLIAVKVEAQRHHALAAHVVSTDGGYARARAVEPKKGVERTLADILRHAAKRRDTRGRRPTLPDAQAVQSQCRGQRFPGLSFRTRGGSPPLHRRRVLAAEVREIDPQGAQETRHSVFGGFQLVVPIVRAGEKALDNAGDADASPARLNAPLVRHRRHAGYPAIGLGSPLSRRFPGRHGGTGLHARAEVHLHRDRLPVALLELGRHEPGRNPRPGGDGLPDFLRR